MSNDKRVGNGSLSRQDEKRKALVTYLCRALKLAKDLGVMDEDWICDRLIDTPSIFSGITVVPSTSGLDPTQPRGYFTDNTQVQLTPDTTGHSSGIGKSLSPRHEVPDDVIEITDEEDRPPSEFIISPKRTPRRLTPIPQRQRPQEQSFQESSRQPSSPRYPLHRTKSKKVRMYRDIVQAFEDLVQNISQHSRVLNETRLSGNDRTDWNKTQSQIDPENDHEDNSSYFQPHTMSTPPPSSFQHQTNATRSHIQPVRFNTTSSRAQQSPDSSPFIDHRTDQQFSDLNLSSDDLPRIVVTPVDSSRRNLQSQLRQEASHVSESARCRGDNIGATTSALIYIKSVRGPSGAEKKTARKLLLNPHFKGG